MTNYQGFQKVRVERFLRNCDELRKGRKASPIGTKSWHGGKEVVKTADGWKPTGKTRSVTTTKRKKATPTRSRELDQAKAKLAELEAKEKAMSSQRKDVARDPS